MTIIGILGRAALIFFTILLSLLHYIVIVAHTRKQISESLYVKILKSPVSLIDRAVSRVCIRF